MGIAFEDSEEDKHKGYSTEEVTALIKKELKKQCFTKKDASEI
ncbi:MAG: hypothetical protein R2739_05640 [Chitinophagales bacterium]